MFSLLIAIIMFLVILMPKLTVQPKANLLPYSGTSPGLSRAKLEPVTAITLAVLVGLGAWLGAGTGIYSLLRTKRSIGFLTNTAVKNIVKLKGVSIIYTKSLVP